VWNATNVSRELRDVAVGLALRYGARVRVVYVEAPCSRLREQNRGRDAVVPDAVMERVMSRWDVPDPTEAHEVQFVVSE
jgi:predicted kinase